MLVGFAFAAVGMAVTTFMRRVQDFDLLNVALIPLFLFSATFFPIGTYAEPLRTIVQLTPLYHGVALIRALTTGSIGPGVVVNVAYLVGLGALGLAVTARRLDRMLLK